MSKCVAADSAKAYGKCVGRGKTVPYYYSLYIFIVFVERRVVGLDQRLPVEKRIPYGKVWNAKLLVIC